MTLPAPPALAPGRQGEVRRNCLAAGAEHARVGFSLRIWDMHRGDSSSADPFKLSMHGVENKKAAI